MGEGTALLFLPEIIRATISLGQAGVYVLGADDEGFSPKYVGRSDTCLRTRLLTHNYLYQFPYFMFMYTSSAEDAFYLEAKWWHDCKAQRLNLCNLIHPDRPNHSHVQCPYCQFSADWKRMSIAS